jgi:acyl carrier protein
MEANNIVRDYITETFLFGDGSRLTDDTSFLAEAIIDSAGIMELIAFLENTFGVAIDDDELLPENLDSVHSIERYLKRKRASLVEDSGQQTSRL